MKTTLALILLFAVFSVQANDIIYTINAVLKGNPATIDSLKLENISSSEVLVFNETSSHSNIKLNLTNGSIVTSIREIKNTELISVVENTKGKITLTSGSSEQIQIALSITNINGQIVYSGKTSLSGNLEITLPHAELYIVKVFSKYGTQSFKSMGSDKISSFYLTQTGGYASPSQKSANLNSITNSKFNLGDTLLITAYKNDFYPKSKQVIIQQTGNLNFIFDTTAVIDIDGNIYRTTTIGEQEWMAEDLKVSHYPNGTEIPLITTDTVWAKLGDNDTDDAYCFYNNINDSRFGALYTYAAAKDACPTGWHLPSDEEWAILENYVSNDGHNGTVGVALRDSIRFYGTDNYGFTALMAGVRFGSGSGRFIHRGFYAYWWTSTATSSEIAYYRNMGRNFLGVFREPVAKSCGYSVRCIKD